MDELLRRAKSLAERSKVFGDKDSAKATLKLIKVIELQNIKINELEETIVELVLTTTESKY